MVHPSRESTMKSEFQGPPPRRPHLLPSDPWAEEAEESLHLKRDDSMITCEGGCKVAVEGARASTRLAMASSEGKGLRSCLADRRDTK